MAGWNEAGNAFVTSSRQGEIRLYELPNPMRTGYLDGVAMTPQTTETIAEALSIRAIDEGRIVPLNTSTTNSVPELASLPDIHQYTGKNLEQDWHTARKSRPRAATNGQRQIIIFKNRAANRAAWLCGFPSLR